MAQAALYWWTIWSAIKVFVFLFGAGTLVIGLIGWISYQLFKWLGAKWIENKFAKQLEEYKADQSRELEKLRHKINSVFDRAQRLHDREFSIFPDIWAKACDAYYATQSYVHGFSYYPDPSQLSDEALEEIMDKLEFTTVEKTEVFNASSRLSTFINISERHQNIDTQLKVRAFAQTLKKDGIFIESEIKEDAGKLLDIIQNVLMAHNFEKKHQRPMKKAEEYDRSFMEDGKALFEKIERDISALVRDAKTIEV